MIRNRTEVLGIVAVIALLLASSVPVGATSHHTEDAVTVDLAEDGSATVTFTMTYDLGSDAEQQAFEDLKNDQQAREEKGSDFLNRMRLVASDAENVTGREMSVTDVSTNISVENSTGVVKLSVSWESLAAVEDGKMTLSEPFASGFDLNQTLYVNAPDGYSVTDASPTPDEQNGMYAWDGDSDLSGFEMTLEEDGEAETTETDGPGFGPVVAILAIAAIAVIARRR